MNDVLCHEENLLLVLDDRSDHPSYSSAVDHLSECAACQKQLDALAAQPAWWADSKRHLRHSTTISVPDLPAPETLVSAQLEESPNCHPFDVATLLEPPRHPEMLGRIGKYEMEREIGRGGMGIVLKGFDSELNRPVAVKLLAPHLASNGVARQRFVREARAAAAVVHENVVAIYGIETGGAIPSIVMPFVSGVSLQQHVEQHGALETVDIVRIGIQIAAGLAAAHEQGLVHRDIKPANILLENSINRIQITDFGLARAAHDANLTHSGIIAGTPTFMSPEQALGETIDGRSDMFSLGSVLYFMATGQLPFSASTPLGVLQAVCNKTPQRLREINADVPETLERVVEKLQAKSPSDRFNTAAELRTYLNDYLAYLQQPTVRKAPARLTTPASRRRWWAIAKKTAVWIAVPLLTAGMLVMGLGKNSAPLEPPTPELSTMVLTTFAQIDVEIADLENSVRKLETFDDSIVKVASSGESTSNAELTAIDARISQLEFSSALAAEGHLDMKLQSITEEIQVLEVDDEKLFN